MEKKSKAISMSIFILTTIAVFYVLVVGKDFLIPLAVAFMLWYVINAMSRTYAKFIPRLKKPNWFTLVLSILTIGLFIGVTIDMMQQNVADVQSSIPRYKENFTGLSAKISNLLPDSILQRLPNAFDQAVQSIKLAPILTSLTDNVLAMLGNISLVLIYVPFLLAEQGTFPKKIREIFPDKSKRNNITSILSHVQDDIQTYLWIKTLTSSLTGVISYFVLSAVGVDFAVFWAYMIFLLNFIPTIGSIIATLFPALLALIQFDTLGPFFIVLMGVGAIQVFVGNLLEPKLMGNSLNVSPFVVMMSLTLWGSIWGIAGMFLSVPITVMLLIVFAHFEQTRHIAVLLSGNGNLKFAKHTMSDLEEMSDEKVEALNQQRDLTKSQSDQAD